MLCRRWGERRSWRRCTSAPYRRSLYGITVDRLGKEVTTSARSTRLVEICRHARDSAGGQGRRDPGDRLPKILQSVSDVGLPPPLLQDTGIRFTAVLRRAVPVPEALTGSARAVYAALVQGDLDVHRLQEQTGLTEPNTRPILRTLLADGFVEAEGRRRVYRRTTRRP